MSREVVISDKGDTQLAGLFTELDAHAHVLYIPLFIYFMNNTISDRTDYCQGPLNKCSKCN